MTPLRDRHCTGLTLLELLVVIVMTALIATLVMQGIGQGLGVFQRVSADQGQIYHELMGQQWLRQTLSAAVANPVDQETFKGKGDAVQLRSFRPLLGSEGIPTSIAWRIASDGALQYQEGDQTLAIPSRSAVQRIEYQDSKAEWHDHWPPDEKLLLPERVRFVHDDGFSVDIALLTQRTPATDGEDLIQWHFDSS